MEFHINLVFHGGNQKGENKESSINKDENKEDVKEKENGKVENKNGNKEEAKEVEEKVEVKEEDSKKEAEKQDVEKENKEIEENKQNAEKDFSGNIPTITKSFFGDKYDLKFLGEDEWLKNVESVYVNDVEYEKKPLIWGDSAGRYNILESDSTIAIGIGNFNKDENIIKIKSKGSSSCSSISKQSPSLIFILSSRLNFLRFTLASSIILLSLSIVTISGSVPDASYINIEENPMAVPNSKIRNGFFILTINSKNLAVSF